MKILDPKQLHFIYSESRQFEQKANLSMQKLRKELSKLNDPSFQRLLSGEEGDAAKQAISHVSNAVEALKQTLEDTSKFIDNKLAGAAMLTSEDQRLSIAGGNTKVFAANIKLRK